MNAADGPNEIEHATRQCVQRQPRFGLPNLCSIAMWLGATLIAVVFCAAAARLGRHRGVYLPRSNDSLYHARRILDAAVGSRGFYQFDERLHAPDGAWIPWPWAYDYLLAKLTQVALWFAPTLDPMAFIAYAPVAWIFVNAALFMAICRCDRSVAPSSAARDAVFCAVAADPAAARSRHDRSPLHRAHVRPRNDLARLALVQAIWKARRRAVALGATLGLACAFHNGLFILQLVPLCCRVRAVAAQRGAAALPLCTLRHRTARHDAAHSVALGAISALACSSSGCCPGFTSTSPCCTALRSDSWHGGRSRGAISGCSAPCALCSRCRSAPGHRRCGIPVRRVLDSRPDRRGAEPLALLTRNVGPARPRATTAGCCSRAPLLLAFYALSRRSRARARLALYYAVAAHVRLGAAARLNFDCTTSGSSPS